MLNFVEIIGKDNVLPHRAGDAGFDIIAGTDPKVVLESKYIEYGTNVRLSPMEDSVHTFILPRSSISNTWLSLANSVGLIDNAYLGEIKFRFRYLGDLNDIDYSKIYKKGDKIGQLVFFQEIRPKLIGVTSFPETERGEGGFGSTDNE